MDGKVSIGERLTAQRRRFLSVLGGTGFATVLAGCGGDEETSDRTDDGGVNTDENGEENGEKGDENNDAGAPTFEIVDLDSTEVTAAATYRAGFDLTATVENAGDATAVQEVTLAVDGEERRSDSIVLGGDEEGQAEFTDIDVFGLDPGATYTIAVSSEADTETASLEIEERDWPGTVGLETVATGFDDRPVAIATPSGSDRLYIVDRSIGIFVYEDGTVHDEPFLDLSDDIRTELREEGVLGLAFHPDFAANRLCYVTYTAPVREGTPDDYNNTSVVGEFEVSEDGLTADRDSERTVIEIPQPDVWHNIGAVDFGPDGYLYVTTGDGGGPYGQGHDHADDWYDGVAGSNAQAVEENLLGGIVRLDVDDDPTEHHRTDPNTPDEPEGDDGYAIPEDNPLVDEEGYDELYAWGLRSPWGAHFDGEEYYVADVGQDDWEEVNLVEKGGNYGWNVKEGTGCFRSPDCPDSTPGDVRGGEPLVDPIIEYSHDLGICVIGGAVYRGDAIPELEGRYVFADILYKGRLFVGIPSDDEGELWDFSALSIEVDDAEKIGQVLAFAEDPDGELLVMANEGDDGNSIHRVVPAE